MADPRGMRLVLPLALLVLVVALAEPGWAQSSLGIGTAEPQIAPSGLFAGTMQWINAQLQGFYRASTGALKGMRVDGSQLWVLVGLSRLRHLPCRRPWARQGGDLVLHARQRGGAAPRRDALLRLGSFAGADGDPRHRPVFLFLRGTALSTTGTTWGLEVKLRAGLGVRRPLLWRKLAPRRAGLRPKCRSTVLSAAHVHDIIMAITMPSRSCASRS